MSQTVAYRFNVASPVTYIRTGKFEALSSKWMHHAMPLDDYELIVETKGNLYLQYLNEKYTLTPGEYLLMQAPVEKSENYRKIRKGFRESECNFYWLHFSCSKVTLTQNMSTYPIDHGRSDILVPLQKQLLYPDRVLLLMRQLQNCIRSGYDTHYADYMCTLILCEIANQSTNSLLEKNEPFQKQSAQKQLYSDIIDYINYFITDNIRVSTIASHFGYNEKYLSQYFKGVSGMSLKQYILNQKMERANFLLSDSNMSISAISDSLGFSDYHNFARTYKNITAMTPSEYRTLYAKQILNHD